MSGQHALLSPSGFKALMLCPAKPAMERGLADDGNEYADEGTAAHFLGAWCLNERVEAASFVGERIVVGPAGESFETVDGPGGSPVFEVTDDMADHVQVYIDKVRERVAMYEQLGATVELFVEQAVPIGHITGEEGAEGTADAVIVADFPDGRVLIEVIDLKFGRGVEVEAEDNPQLKLYALGAGEKYGMVYDFTHASMLICQPRAGGTTEASCTYPELVQWGLDVADAAAKQAFYWLRAADAGLDILGGCRAHEDACRFCKAKGDCPALDQAVSGALQREFTDLTTADAVERDAIVSASVTTAQAAGALGAKMDAVPLVEMWCKAIRGRVEKELLEGKHVAGYKLVPGRKGARAWSSTEDAEKLLKGMRLKKEEMYEFSVISPTTAEKLLKATPKRWAKVQTLITQNDGKPSVAPLSDKRPALDIQPVSSEFTPITEPSPATADDLV